MSALRVFAAVLCAALAWAAPVRADTGMLGWSDADIVQALDAFMPRLMEAQNVPGAQVAFWRNGRLVHARGFGVANAWTRVPVDGETLFEVGTLSAPIASYAALAITARGSLTLDGDVGRGLDPPWLAPGPGGRIPDVTLRQLLTHTSGLGADIRRSVHRIETPPGARFLHSGEGLDYLGYVLAAHGGAPFAETVAREVLRPLGMTAGGFALDAGQFARMATGHAPVWMPVALAGVPFVAAVLVALVLLSAAVRIVWHQPRLELRHLLWALAAGGVAAALAVLETAGLGLAFPILLTAAVFVVVAVAAAAMWRLAFHLIGFTRAREGTVVRRHEARTGLWRRIALLLGLATAAPLLILNVPVPLRAAGDVHPAASLRTTAGDMARFAGELLAPRRLSPRLAAAMGAPQVEVGDGISWGLGIGIRERALPDGGVQRTLWEAGANPGYRSLMVVSPADRTALVVLTNSQTGGAMTQVLAGHVFGGLDAVDDGRGWRLPPR